MNDGENGTLYEDPFTGLDVVFTCGAVKGLFTVLVRSSNFLGRYSHAETWKQKKEDI